jgi:hypothetical protein
MFDLFLSRVALDPWWFAGSVLLMVLMLILFLLSFFRNIRSLVWFYVVAIFMAGLYVLALQWFPFFLETLVSYRSDWSLVFLFQNPSVAHVLTLLVFYFLVFALMGVLSIVLLELWSLLTFRWKRMKVIFERALSESWFVLLFSLASVLFGFVWFTAFGKIDFDILDRLFAMFSFLFLLQFALRMVDNAYLHTPKILMEYLFSMTFIFVLARFFGEGAGLIENATFSVKVVFFEQLFVFFLSVLLTGLMASFFVRALFASTYFLEQHQRKTSMLVSWTSRFLLSSKDRHYSHYRIVLGILLTIVMAFVFELLMFHEWYLTLVPAFFLSYFALFFVLDRQDDMRVRGDLVDKRIESEVRKVFFS